MKCAAYPSPTFWFSACLKITLFISKKVKNDCFRQSPHYELKSMEFQSHVVVTSKCANKFFRTPAHHSPCLQTGKCPTLLKQLEITRFKRTFFAFRGQCYKTFYGLELFIFVISSSVRP
jgi:hypothetical protein